MKLIDIIKSKTDKVEKYIFELNNGLLTEFSYIDKQDGKIIICASTHTGCEQGCKFCHLTEEKRQRTERLKSTEIANAVQEILFKTRKYYSKEERREQTLLISYMGIGEPLNNRCEIFFASDLINFRNNKYCSFTFKSVRFAISTMVPKPKLASLLHFSELFYKNNLKLKIHYSLHSTNKQLRKELMPNALDSELVLSCLKHIRETYKTDIEIHYTLIDKLNINGLELEALENIDFPIKFLKLAESKENTYKACSKEYYDEFIKIFLLDSEYYEPPGADVGASCGQINLNRYLNEKNRVRR